MALDAPLPEPPTIPGQRLKAQREGYGVELRAIAAELRHHRNTIGNWERAKAVDVRRQRLYLAALRKVADQL